MFKLKNEGVMIQSVLRATKILECFTGNNSELGISEISEYMDLSKSTIYGLVNTLKATGYLEQDLKTKKYRLGIKLFELGNIVHSRIDLRAEAKAFCMELSGKYDITVHLATFNEGDVIYIDKIVNYDMQIASSQVGRRAPMYCTGVGKAILAYVDVAYLNKYIFCKELKKITKNTISTHERLIDELQVIRSRGYAVDDEEIEIGLRCVAAPIFNNKAYPIAAVSASASYRKMNDNMIENISKDVKMCAQKISERMGYSINR
jgi:DNA-binding IclR family transcriptional regulator